MGRIVVRTDIVYNNNTLNDIIIVHMSDIHFNKDTKKKKLDKIINRVKKINPDYIVITGDIIDTPKIVNNKKKIKELVNFFSLLGKISKVMISLGNHDVLLDSDHKFFKKLNDIYNIFILDNTSYKDDKIYIEGFTLPHSYYYNITGAESKEILIDYLDKRINTTNGINTSKIALIHSPVKISDKLVLNKIKDFDIILCGHTHGGMVLDIFRFLFPSNMGLIGPRCQLLPSIAKGKIERYIGNKKITIIINEAITKLSITSSSILNNFNFIFNISINKVIIRKKKGR